MHVSPSPATSEGKRLSAPVLAVDYGRRRLGLAISDAMGLTARPLETLARTNRRNDFRRLREIARRHEVRGIVVGNPMHLDGTASEMGAEAAQFAARLARELGLPVELVDERLSSWEAAQFQPPVKARTRKRAEPKDHIAAAVILRDYLDRGHSQPPASLREQAGN
jgi:putative Holliday junction resolvase